MRTDAPAHVEVLGMVAEGFEAVRTAFAANFSERNELGAACCIYHQGRKVVDLWGGVRNKATGEPWEEQTMVLVHSATKGAAAMVMAVAHSRGWLDYDERVAAYWPEFARNGKEATTVRQLLAHHAGLFAFAGHVDAAVVADLDGLAGVMANEQPAWAPGARQAYHALTLGFYEGELLRRIDPQHRSLGQFFAEEIAAPLGLEFYIRLPETIPNARLAILDSGTLLQTMRSMPLPLVIGALNPRGNIHRALMVNPGTGICLDPATIYARNLEVPSGGGVGTARALAQAYGVFATGGKALGLRPETLAALAAPAVPAQRGFFDECLRGDLAFALGFMKPSATWSFGGPRAFGSPGAGGSLGYADPEHAIGYAYVTNRMGKSVDDPRDVALRQAMEQSLQRLPQHGLVPA